MREIYKNDNIFWIVYPLDKDEDPVEPLRNEETFTIMRYGSDGDHINYLFCPEYFCISDELMIRKKILKEVWIVKELLNQQTRVLSVKGH